jgi:hypothetical protein
MDSIPHPKFLAGSPMSVSNDELCIALGELRAIFPDWRFGQMIANLATAARGPNLDSIWECEDDELLVAARRLIEQNRSRLSCPVTA